MQTIMGQKNNSSDTTLVRDIFDRSVSLYSDLAAVEWLVKKDVQSLSYKELGSDVLNLRHLFEKRDYRGRHMALIGSSSVSWITAYLSMITGTQVAIPLDFNLPDADLVELIERSDSRTLFLDPKRADMIGNVVKNCPLMEEICILQKTALTDEEAASYRAAASNSNVKVTTLADLLEEGSSVPADTVSDGKADPEDIATIIYTSGTTGKSKGVMLSQKNLATNIESVEIEDSPGTVMLSVLPIHHAFCLVMDWLKGFSCGATIAINDSLIHMVRNMGIFQPRLMLMVPLMIESLCKKLATIDPSVPKELAGKQVFGGKLEYIFTGGAHLDPYYIDLLEPYGVTVLEGYGMSECSPVISMNGMNENKKGTIGKPLSNVEIKFENGEIMVRGTSVMKGYYKMPEETDAALDNGWLHTGDKGYIDGDGYLNINGRVKNLIILSNGENISPEEIENKLGLFPLVGEVIITGENNGLTAHIFPEQALVDAKQLDAETVHKSLQEMIDNYNKEQPTYKRITGLVVRKTPFIKSSTQKIRRELVLQDSTPVAG